MNEQNQTESIVKERDTTSILKMGLKIIAIILEVAFFLPFCLVSCSGETIKVNGFNSSFGVKIMDERMDGNILCLLLLLLPLAILILSFFGKKITEKLNDKMLFIIATAVGIVDIIILIIYRVKVSDLAKSAYCTVKFTSGYYLEIIFNLALIIAGVLFLAPREKVNQLIELGGASGKKMINMVSKKECPKCGTMNAIGTKFCTQCGDNLENVMVKSLDDNSKVCSQCGKKNKKDAKFCGGCGATLDTEAEGENVKEEL